MEHRYNPDVNVDVILIVKYIGWFPFTMGIFFFFFAKRPNFEMFALSFNDVKLQVDCKGICHVRLHIYRWFLLNR